VQCIEDDVGMKLFCNGVMPCNVVSVGRIWLCWLDFFQGW